MTTVPVDPTPCVKDVRSLRGRPDQSGVVSRGYETLTLATLWQR